MKKNIISFDAATADMENALREIIRESDKMKRLFDEFEMEMRAAPFYATLFLTTTLLIILSYIVK